MLYWIIVYLIVYKQIANWLHGHYKILTTLLGKTLHQQ